MLAEADLGGAASLIKAARVKDPLVAAIPELCCAYAFALLFDERI
jgi:hypothetical protein